MIRIIPILPTLNACLNGTTAAILVLALIAIKKKKERVHGILMMAALFCSTLFLTSYLVYHFHVGSVPYPHHNWTRPLYFCILIFHTFLAVVLLPGVITTLYYILKGNREKHKKWAHWVWPIWMTVSVTGVIVYWMLYQFSR